MKWSRFISSFQAPGAAGAAEGPGAQRQRAEQHPDVVHLGQHHPFSLFFFRRQGESSMSQAHQYDSHIFRSERIGLATSLHHPEIYVTRVGTYVARSCRSQLPPFSLS